MPDYRLAPSILSADFARLGDEVRAVIAAGADLIHFDVMDNHYVPNLTIGPLVCEALKPHSTVPIDVHLMVKPVDRIVPDFAKAGASIISFHPEASEHVDRTIGLIHDCGCKAGLVFNPATPLHWLDHTLDKLDLVLIMSVNPGFGGQSFIPQALAKLKAVRGRIDAARERSGRSVLLEVDGGVKVDNIAEIARAGADTFVAGSAIFGTPDYAATIAKLRSEAGPGMSEGPGPAPAREAPPPVAAGESRADPVAQHSAGRRFAVAAVAFDLDGTLLDTIRDLAAAVNLLLAELGQAPLPEATIRDLVGKGMPNLIRRALAISRGVLPAAVAEAEVADVLPRYQTHYAAILGRETATYPGVVAGLERMAAMGLPLAVVTNKATRFVRPHLALAGHRVRSSTSSSAATTCRTRSRIPRCCCTLRANSASSRRGC